MYKRTPYTILCSCSILWRVFAKFESVVGGSRLPSHLDADIVSAFVPNFQPITGHQTKTALQ